MIDMSCGMPKIAKLGDACCGCGACAARCPKGCVEMVPDAAGFLRPEVDLEACIGCGGCDSVCPAIGGRPEDAASSVCWAKSRDREERLASSSGGIFALLAHEVLRDGGVVVGAAWAPGFKGVRHVLVEDEGRLDEVMRSKYVQSSVGRDVYEGVRGSLRDGRRVLFAGTACQVAGMRAYLGRLADSEGFLAVDVICHGAPSPLLWERWAEHKERVAHTALRAVNMRSKTTGWLSYSASYAYAYDAEKDGASASPAPEPDSCVFGTDWYMKAFLANACLRPSCYACPAKRSCGSDITLGDFWGIQSAHPEVDIEGGVSAVICNTPKGVAAFEAISPCVESGESSLERVLPGNPSLVSPVAPYAKRGEFMRDLEGGVDIEEMMRRHDFRAPLAQRVRARLGAVKRRLLGVVRGNRG